MATVVGASSSPATVTTRSRDPAEEAPLVVLVNEQRILLDEQFDVLVDGLPGELLLDSHTC